MPAPGKDLTTDERDHLRKWAYALVFPGAAHDGLTGLALLIGYDDRRQLSAALSAGEGGPTIGFDKWERLLGVLYDDDGKPRADPRPDRSAWYAFYDAASTHTRREMDKHERGRARQTRRGDRAAALGPSILTVAGPA